MNLEEHLERIYHELSEIKCGQEKIMALIDDLQSELDTIKADVADSLGQLTAVHAQLDAAIASGADVVKLQALSDEAKGIIASFPVKAAPPAAPSE